MSDSFNEELQSGFGEGLIHLWDGLKYILLDQGIIPKSDPLFTSNSRRGKNSGALAVSKEQVYAEEIIDLAKKCRNFDHSSMYLKYGKFTKKSGGKNPKKTDQSMIQPTSNFTFTKETDLDKIDEEDSETSSIGSFQGYDQSQVEKNNENPLEQSLIDTMDTSAIDQSILENRKSSAYHRNRQLHSSTSINPLNNSFLQDINQLPQVTGLPQLSTVNHNLNQSLMNSFTPQQPMYPVQAPPQNTNNLPFSLADIAKLIQQSENNVNSRIDNVHSKIHTKIDNGFKEINKKVEDIESTVNSHGQDINYLKRKVDSQVDNKELASELEKLKQANKSSENIAEKVQTEIKSALAKSKNEIQQTVDDTISQIRSRSQSLQSTISQPRRSTAVWGDGEDSINSTIQRFYTFAASKIPKQDIYDEGWFKRSNQEIFDKNNVKAEVITVEPVEANFQTAKTKTFKIYVKAKDGLNPDDFQNPKNWVRGTRITRFKQRSKTFSESNYHPYRPRTNHIRNSGNDYFDKDFNSDMRYRDQEQEGGSRN